MGSLFAVVAVLSSSFFPCAEEGGLAEESLLSSQAKCWSASTVDLVKEMNFLGGLEVEEDSPCEIRMEESKRKKLGEGMKHVSVDEKEKGRKEGRKDGRKKKE